MNKLLSVTLAALCLIVMLPPAQAKPAKAIKATQPVKERLVLMPLHVGEENESMQGAMETALVEGLEQKYQVFSGDRVMLKVKEIFNKESKTAKKECDETKCMEGIAMAFQSDLIASANVTKIEGGYLLSLNIRNVEYDKSVYSKSTPCKGCDAFQVIKELKELSGAPAPVVAGPVAAEAPPAKVNQNDPDAVLWAEAQKGNSADDYQVYIDTYPKGKYLPFAKARIKKLKDEAQVAAAQQEQSAWDTAQKENSEDSFGSYLKGYPTGRFAGLATVRMDKLKNDAAAREEADLWKKADSSNDKTAIENYLSKYPAGRYIAQARAKLKAIKEEEAKDPAMVTIPGGGFQIGASTESDNPVRTVSIRSFEIGKYEVTQKEWREVMGGNPSNFTACGDNCPVEKVSWEDVQTFLQKLNQKTGRQYRLPSEEEWEVACYGGSKTEYCGSSNIDSVAWYDANSNSTTHPVGQKQANGYGLYDMSGNVWEWMENEYSPGRRALRGGSWSGKPQLARAAHRNSSEPVNRYSYYGFRLARTLP